MNGAGWGSLILRAAAWAGVYVLLAAGRSWWERWWMARWQGRPARPPFLPSRISLSGGWQLLAGLFGLLASAAVPLAPPIPVAGTTVSFHLLNSPTGALFPLAATWAGSILLAAAAPPDRWGRRQIGQTAARLLAGALPILLAGLSLVITGGLLHPTREGTLHLSTLIDVQGGWAGWRWLGVLQPLAAALWMIGALPVHPGTQARTGFGWQLVLLAHTLLTGAICWGGWQGPGVERLPWLGLAYTLIKVAVVTLFWSWIEVRLADKNHAAWIQMSWPIYISLGVANLVLTTMVTVIP